MNIRYTEVISLLQLTINVRKSPLSTLMHVANRVRRSRVVCRELTCKLLYAGSNIQNASKRFALCMYFIW